MASVLCPVCGHDASHPFLQGVLQSLTSTVGSAASTVTSTAKSAVNRLTGDGSNGLTQSYGPTVRDPSCRHSDPCVCTS